MRIRGSCNQPLNGTCTCTRHTPKCIPSAHLNLARAVTVNRLSEPKIRLLVDAGLKIAESAHMIIRD
jgi:hypothetical protein